MGRTPGDRRSQDGTLGLVEAVTPDGLEYWYDPNDPFYGYLSNNRFSTKYPISYLWGSAAPASDTQETKVGQEAREYTAAALDGAIGTIYGTDRVGADVFFGPVATNNQTSTIVGLGFGDGPYDSLVKVEDSAGRLVYNGGGAAISGPGVSFNGASGALPDSSTYDFSSSAFHWYPGVDAPATADAFLYGATGEASATFERYPGLSYGAGAINSSSDNQLSFTDLKWTIKARKVYDPRKDSTNGGAGTHRLNDPTTWEWSENAMLCTADFVRCKYVGIGAGANGINWASVARIATICDQVQADGKKRFTLNITIKRDAPLESHLRTLLAHFRGTFAIVADATTGVGQFKFYIDDTATDVASGLTGVVIDESNCRVVKRPPTLSSQTPTQVFWSWVDPSRDYQPAKADYMRADAQAGLVDIIPAEYNGEGTRYPGEAQSNATYWLKKRNAGPGVSVIGTKAYPFLALEIYDVVTCNLPSFALASWMGRIVRIGKSPNGEYAIDLEPYDPTIYGYITKTVETKPTITAPNPYAAPPAVTVATLVEELYRDQTGVTQSHIKVTWVSQTSYPYYAATRVRVQKSDGTALFTLDEVPSGPLYIPSTLTPGITYTVTFNTVNLQGKLSADYTPDPLVTRGKTTPPADVPLVYAQQRLKEVQISIQAATDPDIRGYEYRRGTTADTWATMQTVAQVGGSTLYILDTPSNSSSLASGTWRYAVKAFDYAKNYSQNAVTVDVVVQNVGPTLSEGTSAYVPGLSGFGTNNTYRIPMGSGAVGCDLIYEGLTINQAAIDNVPPYQPVVPGAFLLCRTISPATIDAEIAAHAFTSLQQWEDNLDGPRRAPISLGDLCPATIDAQIAANGYASIAQWESTLFVPRYGRQALWAPLDSDVCSGAFIVESSAFGSAYRNIELRERYSGVTRVGIDSPDIVTRLEPILLNGFVGPIARTGPTGGTITNSRFQISTNSRFAQTMLLPSDPLRVVVDTQERIVAAIAVLDVATDGSGNASYTLPASQQLPPLCTLVITPSITSSPSSSAGWKISSVSNTSFTINVTDGTGTPVSGATLRVIVEDRGLGGTSFGT